MKRPQFVYAVDEHGEGQVMVQSADNPAEWWDLYNERVYDDAFVARHWPIERAAALAAAEPIQLTPFAIYDRVAAILAGDADY